MERYVYIDATSKHLVVLSVLEHDALYRMVNGGSVNAISTLMDVSHLDYMCKEDPNSNWFECWDLDDYENPTEIVLNIEWLREFWLNSLRDLRNSRLTYLDSVTLRAVSKGDNEEVARIESIKQELRNMPERIDNQLKQAKDSVDIFNIQPGVLFAE